MSQKKDLLRFSRNSDMFLSLINKDTELKAEVKFPGKVVLTQKKPDTLKTLYYRILHILSASLLFPEINISFKLSHHAVN